MPKTDNVDGLDGKTKIWARPFPHSQNIGEGDGGGEDLWAPVVAWNDPAPILPWPKHDLDAIAALVAAHVVLHAFRREVLLGKPGRRTFLFQRVYKPVGIVTAVSQQPTNLW
jgi:hypothetical protein